MHLNRLTEKAAIYARAAHDAVGQVRKYTGEPYWKHTERVAETVLMAGHCNNLVCAAFLHDTIEDTLISHENLVYEFGLFIAHLVLELTDQYCDPSLGNRKRRKELECKRLSQISYEAATIKYADLLDNTESIVKHDKEFAKVYLAEKRGILEVMAQGDPVLYFKCWDILKEAEEELNNG